MREQGALNIDLETVYWIFKYLAKVIIILFIWKVRKTLSILQLRSPQYTGFIAEQFVEKEKLTLKE